ncbi:MAG TPA: methionyl-tRNA formyltransferase [Solirubrobacteraceae bacterium]|nr:methionyl-tRNA formyltransferase [Solirubrobacteraceae bacterium]
MTATVFLGTSEFAAAILARLHDSPHRPALVLSRPDAPRGRGRRLAAPPVITLARELGLPTAQPVSVNTPETLAEITAAGAGLAVVCAFGALIKPPLLSAMPILNVHPSLLPRWRGAAPVERAILAGDRHTGVSIMALTAGLDSGPVCLTRAVAIAADDDYGSLSARLQGLGGDLLVEAIDTSPPFIEQPEAGVTYAEKITPEDRRLEPAGATATELARRVRALSPHIGAHLELGDGARLGVWSARPVDAGEGPRFIACREGVLELLEVQPAGRRRMPAADWARGLAR